jgi:hypothetical protein
MPIKYTVTKYGCKFKCGRKHQLKSEWVEKHEPLCFNNPERRGCATCNQHDFKPEYSESDTGYWEKSQNMCDLFEGYEFPRNEADNSKITMGCFFWGPSEQAQKWIEQFSAKA